MPHLTSCAAVGQDAAGVYILAAAEDLDDIHLVGQVLDVGSLSQEAAVKHEEQVGGLVHACRGGAAAPSEWPWRQSAASCQLFCWRQSLCSAKGGAAAALLLHESGEGAEKEQRRRGVREARKLSWCSVQMEVISPDFLLKLT